MDLVINIKYNLLYLYNENQKKYKKKQKKKNTKRWGKFYGTTKF